MGKKLKQTKKDSPPENFVLRLSIQDASNSIMLKKGIKIVVY